MTIHNDSAIYFRTFTYAVSLSIFLSGYTTTAKDIHGANATTTDEAAVQQDQMRQHIMQQVMLPNARERLARIAIVKPEKARAIEDLVAQMAQRGQLAAKIDEDKLIELLNQVGVSEENQRTKVTMKRRTYFDDDDEDDDDDDF
ncbi:putative PDCD5-like superfamily protein [Plasmopara halstedii]